MKIRNSKWTKVAWKICIQYIPVYPRVTSGRVRNQCRSLSPRPSLCPPPYAGHNSRTAGWMFVAFGMGGFFEKLPIHFDFYLYRTILTTLIPVLIEQEAGWAPKLVWTLWRRDKSAGQPVVVIPTCVSSRTSLNICRSKNVSNRSRREEWNVFCVDALTVFEISKLDSNRPFRISVLCNHHALSITLDFPCF
jgi:hypothetical protein